MRILLRVVVGVALVLLTSAVFSPVNVYSLSEQTDLNVARLKAMSLPLLKGVVPPECLGGTGYGREWPGYEKWCLAR